MNFPLFSPNIGDLAAIQRASFLRFLRKGIQEELEKLPNPFTIFKSTFLPEFLRILKKDKKRKTIGRKKGIIKKSSSNQLFNETKRKKKSRLSKRQILKQEHLEPSFLFLYPSELKFSGPDHSFRECVHEEISYTIRVFILSEYSFFLNYKESPLLPLKRQTRFQQEIFVGEIPLMTEEGTFLITGCERIIVSQIVRSPGIYFRYEPCTATKSESWLATIISKRGIWTTFICEQNRDTNPKKLGKQKRIYIQAKQFRRIQGLEPDAKFNRDLDVVSDNYRVFLSDFFPLFGLKLNQILDSSRYPSYLLNYQLEGEKKYVSTLTTLPKVTRIKLEEHLLKGLTDQISDANIPEMIKERLLKRAENITLDGKIKTVNPTRIRRSIVRATFFAQLRQNLIDLESRRTNKHQTNKIPFYDYYIAKMKSYPFFLNSSNKEIQEGITETEQYNQCIIARYLDKKKFFTKNPKLMLAVTAAPYTILPIDIEKLYEQFYDSDSGKFVIGENGRCQMNAQLGLNLPSGTTYVTPYDLLKMVEVLEKLQRKERLPDDIDDLRHKIVRSIGELLQIQFRFGLLSKGSVKPTIKKEPILFGFRRSFQKQFLTKKILNKKKQFVILENKEAIRIKQYLRKKKWLDPRPLIKPIFTFFKTSQLSQLMDQLNPLSEITQKRRISVFGPNGLKRGRISPKIRDIQPSQYGRLCPIETPEGQNAGLVSVLTVFGRINRMGFLETPYFWTPRESKEFLLNLKNSIAPVFLDVQQESNLSIGFKTNFTRPFSVLQELNEVKVKSKFSVRKVNEIRFSTISALQIISIATSLIPFLEHNDANRALMGANMQRQAVPLMYPKKAIVGTGLETAAILDSILVVKSYCEGFVHFVSSTEIQIKDNSGQCIQYSLEKYRSSNQKTTLNQRPLVWKGEHIFSGQIIADGPGTLDAELAIGQNLLVAYMPWEGYNYEDAIVINERVVVDDSLTSIHIFEYTTDILPTLLNRKESITKDFRQSIINTQLPLERAHLNRYGIARIGSYVQENDVMIGKISKSVRQISRYDAFLKDLVARQTSEKGIEKQNEKLNKQPVLTQALLIRINELKKIRKKIGSIIFNDNPLIKRKIKILTRLTHSKQIQNHLKEIIPEKKSKNEFRTWKYNTRMNRPKPEPQKLPRGKRRSEQIYDRDISERLPKGMDGRIISVDFLCSFFDEKNQLIPLFSKLIKLGQFDNLDEIRETMSEEKCFVRFSLAQLRQLEVGDKLAGRHGNKGIVSRILAMADMPYLPDGTPIDLIFNPLGVPSRMNVGQLFESILGFAGQNLGRRFKILPFDETYGAEASRILVNQKMKEMAIKMNNSWFLSPDFPGKMLLKDGRTGEYFDNPVAVGTSYILKLIHLVEDKIHARSIGPYNQITEQPLAGKAKMGGQRFGEMEVWALESYGCSHTLQELLTVKSDDFDGRQDLFISLQQTGGKDKPNPSIPESFLLLARELNALGLDFSFQNCLSFEQKEKEFIQKDNNPKIVLTAEPTSDFFDSLEERLQLRTLIQQEKSQYFREVELFEQKLTEENLSIQKKIPIEDDLLSVLKDSSFNENVKIYKEKKFKNDENQPNPTLDSKIKKKKKTKKKTDS